ncbi:FAD-dependent hydroxylase [Komarekiella sp. 'clone 1']|uniref:FAD-dependent hydroxylase n=1 Tax=Komarekiella delphini-convector SJRDD-AB1 TaxID=2593771 RepID=A0AA40T510_9NOST|nr:FAD-dependent hydroxylase [Komarekiella delphini-convector]MBD6620769.1 FAD-dependent hydroxylase [Komarekiella delphini-convector SJRDD-AB1]
MTINFEFPAITSLPKMDLTNCDVVIVGGGISGLTLACGLQSSGLRILVVEAQQQQQAIERARAYALSPMTSKIFCDLGLWSQIAPKISHFSRVLLSDTDYPHRVEFCPKDLGEPAVYYCGEHGVLMAALQQKVATAVNISCWYETQVVEVRYGAETAEVVLDNSQGQQRLQSKLVVAADGINSQIRSSAGIKTNGWAYWQSCITAFVSPERSHQNIGYERFWPSGPFAILPLPDNRCQIVWIAPHAEAQAIVALPSEQFMTELRRRYGEQMGKLTLLSQPLVFPSQLMQSHRYCQPRLALLGDAAHCCHPVGGQGLNMGIRDAAALAQVLQTAQQYKQDLGSLAVLKRYDRWRRYENWVVLAFTDILNRSFSNHWLPIVRLRRLVLRLIIYWSFPRRLLLRLMTGLWGRQPQLDHSSLTVLQNINI